MRSKQAQRGFTLIELLVVVALLGVVATIAVPSFSRIIESNQLTTTGNDLVGALNLARSEAVRLGAPVSLVPAGSFTAGFRVVDDSGSIISEFQGASGSYSITRIQGANPRFSSTGLLTGTSPFPVFDVCKASGEDGVKVTLTGGGQIRSQRFTCP